MNDIKQLIDEILNINTTKGISGVIDFLGILNEKKGATYYLFPKNEFLSSITINYNDNKIKRIVFIFKEDLSLNELEYQYGALYGLSYSNYDDLSFFSFKIGKDYLIFLKEGFFQRKKSFFIQNKLKLQSNEIYSKNIELEIK
jgi:hypothetical protein